MGVCVCVRVCACVPKYVNTGYLDGQACVCVSVCVCLNERVSV